MRAQSSSSSAFGFGPLKAIAIREADISAGSSLDKGPFARIGYAGDIIGYGVELSTPTARKSIARQRGRRGLDRKVILDAAFDMLSRDGEAGFSVRKLGSRIGVDPMTVLHHFGSKDELLRRIADRALATVELPLPSSDWRADLRNVAAAYRDLAHRHPRIFHLHFRFHATGPADHASSEVVYRALRSAGLPDAETAGLGLAFYAFILGYALAEAEGLLRPISEEDEAELRALDPLACPATLALIPAFKSLDRDAAFDVSVDAFIDGVAFRCNARSLHQRSRTRSPQGFDR
jgi:AcrR family transcriptional regulator